MAMQANVSVSIRGGPSATVPWTQGMTALDAMQKAYDAINSPQEQFTFALQYYGSGLGYLVVMINEVYDSFISRGGQAARPFYYWEFLHNNQPAQAGVDNTQLKPGDSITFEFEMYDQGASTRTLAKAKFEHQTAKK
jgi:hypothetical protein